MKRWVAACAGAALLGASGLGWLAYKYSRPIEIVAIGDSATPSRPYGTHSRPVAGSPRSSKPSIGDPSWRASAAPEANDEGTVATALTLGEAQAFFRSSEDVQVVKFGDAIRRLEREATVNDVERKRLREVFRNATAMQAAIDTITDSNEQRTRQRELLEQIDIRVRRILMDRRRIDLVRDVLAGLPRIDGDEG